MTLTISIGELAKASEVPAKTIRFYEEIGLISSPQRRENGYRVYPRAAIQELSLIKYARDLGLPIPKIKKLMQGCENHDCAHSKEYLEKEIDEYIQLLDNKLNELQELKKRLKSVNRHLPDMKMSSGDAYCCSILGYLAKMKGGEKL